MSKISIMIAGDYSPKERFQKELDSGTYKELFPNVKNILSSVDYSVINFETTIPTSESKPINKIGSHLSASENSLAPLHYLGFKMLTMANNHFMDYGRTAMANTIKLAAKYGFDVVGAGENLSEARQYKVIELHGKEVAFINACEHEFSIATEKKAGCNPLDIIDLSKDIRCAKEHADYVIVIIHGGNEHYKLPSPRMKKIYRFFVDQGADVVLNHHQHCYSGYDIYKGKPIFYGLGNFCFDSNNDIKYRHETYNYGYMVKLEFSDVINFELIPYEQCYKRPGVYFLTGQNRIDFFKDIDNLNSIILNDAQMNKLFIDMARSKRNFIYRGFRPYIGQLANALYYRGLLPSFLNRARLQVISAILECEAHKDVLMSNLRMEN